MSESDNTIRVVFHPNHLGMSEGEEILDTVLRMIAWANADCECRQEDTVDKYGAEIDNDVFLMHPYCWCEKEGECPWCTGCRVYAEKGLCQACREPYPHLSTCYQTELNAARKTAGLSYSLDGNYIEESIERTYDERNQIENAIYDDLCQKHQLDRDWGAAIHCDCGADEARRKAIRERGCDYSLGRGIFARFQPWTLDHERNYYDPPNFWYKPTNFRVGWYKYIGRDTVTNRDLREGELEQIIRDCVPNPAETYRELSEASEERSSAFSQMIEAIFKG